MNTLSSPNHESSHMSKKSGWLYLVCNVVW